MLEILSWVGKLVLSFECPNDNVDADLSSPVRRPFALPLDHLHKFLGDELIGLLRRMQRVVPHEGIFIGEPYTVSAGGIAVIDIPSHIRRTMEVLHGMIVYIRQLYCVSLRPPHMCVREQTYQAIHIHNGKMSSRVPPCNHHLKRRFVLKDPVDGGHLFPHTVAVECIVTGLIRPIRRLPSAPILEGRVHGRQL